MTEQLSSDNTKKLLLEGNAGGNIPQQRPRVSKKKHADVVVENATEKRYLWTARAFAVVFAVSLCCNIILSYAITTLMPMYRVQPYLLSFADKEEQIYTVEPVAKIKEYKYLTELFVREYVLLRNTFINDMEEMERRWGTISDNGDKSGLVSEMSSDGVYMKFKNEFAKKILEQIRQYNIRRRIEFTSVSEVDGNWWTVEFKTFDMAPSYETERISKWIARVRVVYRGKTTDYVGRLKNPLGFTVVDYKIEQRKG